MKDQEALSVLDKLSKSKFMDDDDLEQIRKKIYVGLLTRYMTSMEITSKIEEDILTDLDNLSDAKKVVMYNSINKSMTLIDKSIQRFFPSKMKPFEIDLKKYNINEDDTANVALKKILALNLTNLLEMAAMVSDELKQHKLGSLEHWKLLETSKATNDRIIQLAASMNRMQQDDDKDSEEGKLAIQDLLNIYDKAVEDKNKVKLAKPA